MGCPMSSTAAPNGSHCDLVISVSTTVMPSSSITTPTLATPWPAGVCSQAYTPCPSCVSAPSAIAAPYRPSPTPEIATATCL